MIDAIVVGAGIVGAACAEALSRDGLRVIVLDSGGVGCGTTAAGMGHIVVMDDSPAQWQLTKYSCELWRRLKQEMPGNTEYQETGTLWVAADEEEFSHVLKKVEDHNSQGVSAEVLDAKTLAEAEPNLRPGLAGALYVPHDGVIYPPTAASYLLRKSRCIVRSFTAVASIMEQQVVLSNGEKLFGKIVVNAAGIEAAALTKGVEIKARKGHLVITDRYPGFARHQLVELGYLKSAHGTTEDSVAFNVQPRATGQMLIGSSRQYGSNSKSVEVPILRRMLQRAAMYMPGLRDLHSVRVWTGFRPATPDKLPLIGPVSESVYVAAGHEGLGITTSLATGQLIADMVMGRQPPIDPTPYLPSRAIHG